MSSCPARNSSVGHHEQLDHRAGGVDGDSYREKKILRRIKASPLKPRTFFAAQVLAYLVMSLVQATVILGLGAIVFRVPVGGNFLIIGVLILFCNIVFLNLGFIVGAYSKTVAAASGFGNVVVLPLVMFSGVFFPPEMLPGVLSEVMRYLPLAPMVDILRGITLGAKTVLDFPFEIGLIAAWIGHDGARGGEGLQAGVATHWQLAPLRFECGRELPDHIGSMPFLCK